MVVFRLSGLALEYRLGIDSLEVEKFIEVPWRAWKMKPWGLFHFCQALGWNSKL